MITLTFSVIANLFFGQVTTLGLRGHQRGPDPPASSEPHRSIPRGCTSSRWSSRCSSTPLLRYVARTPFGLALQGIRDDPVRMRSLGFNVALHRTLAFALAGFVAAVGGILFVWWNGQIAPASIGLGPTIDVLIIAVIGGLYRLEGAWLGAFVFVVLNNYAPGRSASSAPRFNTLIGVIFLVIVLVSPDGLIGLWERAAAWRHRRGPRGRHAREEPGEPDTGRTKSRNRRRDGGASRERSAIEASAGAKWPLWSRSWSPCSAWC